MRTRKKLVTAGAVLSTLALTTLFTATPAQADDDPSPAIPPASATDTVGGHADENQNRLMDFKTWLIGQPGIAESGYIESVNDSSTLSTTLLWSGPENDLQKSIIAAGESRGITVKVKNRKFSLAELMHASDVLSAPGSTALKGFKWSAVVTVDPNFDGVRVMGTPQPTAAAGKKKLASSQAEAERLNDVAEKAADVGGVDVKIDTGVSVTTMATHRWDDTPAFNAGGYMNSATEGSCSTGFSVKVGGTPHVMTARHCMAHDYKTLVGNRSYGDGVRNSTDGGARQMSAKGSPLMFDGAWNNAAGYRKTVIGYGDVSAGDNVCTSGAQSGVHCGIKVRDLRVRFDDEYPHVSDSRFMTIFAVAGSGAAACEGDSGGPVLTPRNTADVLAVGMVQGGPLGKDENGFQWTISASTRDAGPRCSKGVFFSAMRTIVNTLPNASLVTG